MKISDIITEGMVFARVGKGGASGKAKVKMKWRCETGGRAGRLVSSPAQCGASVDVAKRAQMKKTRARTKAVQARRAKKTKKVNVASRVMQALNKFKRRDALKKVLKPKKVATSKRAKPKTPFLKKISPKSPKRK